MKIDFRKLELKDVEGNSFEMDIAKELGNIIYSETVDIGELELARSIYLNGEIDVNPAKAEILKKYIEGEYRAFVKETLIPILDNIINFKK